MFPYKGTTLNEDNCLKNNYLHRVFVWGIEGFDN